MGTEGLLSSRPAPVTDSAGESWLRPGRSDPVEGTARRLLLQDPTQAEMELTSLPYPKPKHCANLGVSNGRSSQRWDSRGLSGHGRRPDPAFYTLKPYRGKSTEEPERVWGPLPPSMGATKLPPPTCAVSTRQSQGRLAAPAQGGAAALPSVELNWEPSGPISAPVPRSLKAGCLRVFAHPSKVGNLQTQPRLTILGARLS